MQQALYAQRKLLNFYLLLSSLIGYLEWGYGNHAFLFEVEYQLLFGTKGTQDSFTHPFVLVPLLGQLLILITLFQNKPSKPLTLGGMVCIGLIMVFIFAIGIMGLNIKIALSAVPFIAIAVAILLNFRKNRIRI